MLKEYLPHTAEAMAESLMRRYGLLKDRWSYDYGVVWRGMEALYALTGEKRWFDYIRDAMDTFVQEDGSIRDYSFDAFNLDYVCNGRQLLYLYKATGEEKYRRAADLLREQLRRQPRTSDGGFWHKKCYPYQMWLDGLHMAAPFYTEYCLMTGDDAGVCDAAKQEIIRRHYNALCNMRKGSDNDVEIQKIELLLRKLSCNPEEERRSVAAANAKAEETGAPAVAIELNDGRIVTGKTSSLLGASSAALLNALKALAGIEKEVDLISPEILEPIQRLKTENLGNHNPRLHTDEVLIALSISAVNNDAARRAFDAISGLRYAEVHSSVILSQVDAATFRKLGVNLSCEPKYQTKKLYHKS